MFNALIMLIYHLNSWRSIFANGSLSGTSRSNANIARAAHQNKTYIFQNSYNEKDKRYLNYQNKNSSTSFFVLNFGIDTCV